MAASDPITALTVLRNGAIIVGTAGGKIKVRGASSHDVTLPDSGIHDIVEMADGRVAVAYARPEYPDAPGVMLYNLDSKQAVVVADASASKLLALSNGSLVCASPGNCSLYGSGSEGKLEVVLGDTFVHAMVALPGERVIAIAAGNAVCLWTLESNTLEPLFCCDIDDLESLLVVGEDLVVVWNSSCSSSCSSSSSGSSPRCSSGVPRIERWNVESKQCTTIEFGMEGDTITCVTKVDDSLVVIATADYIVAWHTATDELQLTPTDRSMVRLAPGKDRRVWCAQVDGRVGSFVVDPQPTGAK